MRLPWKLGFRLLMNANIPDQQKLAAHLRSIAVRNEPIPPEALTDIADMLDPQINHQGPTLRLVRAKGGKPANRRWLSMAGHADRLIADGMKPDAALNETAAAYGVSERTVRRALEKYYAHAKFGNQSEH